MRREHAGSTRPNVPFLKVFVGIAFTGAAVLAALAVLAWATGLTNGIADSTVNGIGLAGISVSFVALGVALMIFRVQSMQAKTDNDALHGRLGDLQVLFEQAQNVPLDNEETKRDQETDEYEADSHEADQVGSRWTLGGKEGRFLTRSKVPLSVVADIVWGWRVNEIGKDRTWTVDYLVGAFRPTGRGNHPWYLYFRTPDGQKSIWRLYRGGRSNSKPTVREVSAEIGD